MQAEFPLNHYIVSQEYENFSEVLKFLDIFGKGIAGFCESETNMSGREKAVLAIASSTISITHSSNLLVRNGYLLAAKVLIRPLIERVAVLACITKSDQYLAQWYKGWKQGSGPKNSTGQSTFDALVLELNNFGLLDDEPRPIGQIVVDDYKVILNSEQHGSFNSAELNKTNETGAYAAGPNPDNLPEFKKIVGIIGLFAMQLQYEVYQAVPRLKHGDKTP
jgi:hypothetical protein